MNSTTGDRARSDGEASTLAASDPPIDDRVDSSESWLAELAQAPSFGVSLDAGDVVGGEYVVERALGEGAMGIVFVANHAKLQRKVALKLHRVQSEQAAARLLAEARATAGIQHENVLVVHSVGTWKRHVFLAMEFIDGPTARQWVAASRRSWREIVELYLEAGRGLAAAHAKGVIHRDFKPDNVLVPRTPGGRGRVKVADFGLARRADDDVSRTARGTTEQVPRPPARGLAGSPAYMAPEQYQRSDVDARADQFAFCVSLFEALFGHRPFDGDDLPTLARAIAAGVYSEPEGFDVPPHVRRVIRRGLSPDPQDRFGDMPALLEALASDPTARRRRALGAVVAVGIGASITWAATRRGDPLPECTKTPEIAAWWTDAMADDLHTSLTRSGRAHAERTFARVDRALDTYRDDASALLDEACRATLVDGTRARVELEAQRGCLVQRGREVAALVDVLGAGTPEIADRAVTAAEGLRPIVRCEDPDELDRVDDDTAPGVIAALQTLAQVRSLRLAGRFDEASTMGRAALDDVRALGRPRLLAELLLVVATAEGSLHRTGDASAALQQASAAAVVAGADALAAEIAAQGLYVDGYVASSRELGEQWASLGWAWLERAKWPRDLLRELLGQRALARRTADRFPEALGDLSLALALAQGEGDTGVRAALLAALGETYRHMGRHDLARTTAQQAIDSYVSALGERHPFTINALNLLASVDLDSGRFDDAETTLRRALTLGEAVLGPDSRRLVDVRVNLATVLVNTGRAAEAVEIQQRAYDVVSAPGEPRDRHRVIVTANLATQVATVGDTTRARALQQEAVALAREVAGPQSSLYARQLITAAELAYEIDPAAASATAHEAETILAKVAPTSLDHTLAAATEAVALAMLDRCDDARERLATVLPSLRAAVGEDNPGLSSVLAAQGHCEAAAGRNDEAVALLERSARLNDAVMPPNPLILAWQTEAELARGDLARAKAVHTRLVAALDGDDGPQRARADALAAALDAPAPRRSPR